MDIGELPNPFKSKDSSRDGDSGEHNNSSLYGIGDYDEAPPQQQQQQPQATAPAAAAAAQQQQQQQEKGIAGEVTEKAKEQAQKATDKVTGN